MYVLCGETIHNKAWFEVNGTQVSSWDLKMVVYMIEMRLILEEIILKCLQKYGNIMEFLLQCRKNQYNKEEEKLIQATFEN